MVEFKKVMKALSCMSFIIFVIFAIMMTYTTAELRHLKKLQEEQETTFLLKDGQKIVSIMKVDRGETISFLPEFELDAVNAYASPAKVYITEKIDKKDKAAIIFDIAVLESSPFVIPDEWEGVIPKTITKEDIIRQLKDQTATQNIKDSYFSLVIPSMFNLETPESFRRMIDNYEQENIKIYPKLKIFTFLSLIPKGVLETATKISIGRNWEKKEKIYK